MEPKAPPLLRDRAASVSAAPGFLLPILALSLALCVVPSAALAAEPQPDAAPQGPTVAPDPAPTNTAPPPQQSAPAPPVSVAPQVPTVTQQPAAPAATPSTAMPRHASPKPNAERKPKPGRREGPVSRPERRAKPADQTLLLRVDSFLPGVQGDEDSPSHLVLLAAAALLALVMASGSLLSVAARVWRSPLR